MNKHGSMNRIYRLVWNDARSAWIPVAENARGRGKRGRCARLLAPVIAALALHAMPAHAEGPVGYVPAPHELPTGGQVVAGSAVIAPDASSTSTAVLNINQSTDRAVIDWQTFNLGSEAQVNFNQPNANSATLNRVLDSNPSQIFGKITATGQIFLTNPNGVYFGKGASVDVGALTATTHSIGTNDFMVGNLVFKRNGATGSVVNEGELRAAIGGYIALLAPEVRNSGIVIARLGTVALASGEAFTLNFDDNHLTGITVQPSTMKALVDNKGVVLAPGGLIILSAQAFDRLQGGVVNNSGTIEATGLAMKGGRIVLEASSSVSNSGTINANAGVDGSPAGSISINAPEIINSGVIEAAAVNATNAFVAGGSIALSADTITQTATGSLDTSGFTGGNIELNATQDITLAGTLSAAAIADTTAPVDSTAHGGNIAITAAHNVTLQDAVVDASGDAAGGQILIQGGSQDPTNPLNDHPTLALLGETQLRTSSRRGRGGNVTLTSDHVDLLGDTSIDASGETGGGDVFVGGGFHGTDASIANASQVVFGSNASIDASAITNGDGGHVAVWSDDQTTYAGNIAARGGSDSGNGGFVEVSGKGRLDFNGTVNTLAAHGQVGTLLLDPYNLTISSSSDNNVTGTFDASGTGSILNVTTLQNALASNDVTVTTGSSGGEAGTLTVANTVGWFSDYSLTLTAAGTLTVNNGVSLTAAGNGNITFTTTGGDIINSGAIRTFGGNFTATTLQGAGGAIYGAGSYNIAGTATFTTAGNIGLSNAANKFVGAVSLLAGGSTTLVNSVATVLKGATGDSNGISITSGGSITTGASPSGITTTGALLLTTTSGTNGSISYTGPVSTGGNITLSADGNGAISIADINGAATFASVIAGGAITLGDSGTGALTFDSASGNVLSGTAGSSGQASGAVTITGSAITINDPFVTKGGNLNLISTSGAVTANTGANLTTTANADTGTASGGVTVTAANGITLQNIVTTGANNSLGVGSNSAAVTLTSTTGDINVGAITTSGGNATAGATSNRNGGNAGNMVITAPTGIIYLNGDLNAIGGSPVGTATQGLGGYIDVENAVVLTANRSISSGATSGDIDFKSTINSDGTSRSLSVTAGIGAVRFFKAIGNSAALSTLSVASSTTTTAQGNVTTNAAGGVSINATTINLGDDTVTNGLGAITINTLTGNGTVNLNATNTYLTDAVTFTRGTGTINFAYGLYSKSNERNDLTFNGTGGGAINTGFDVGGSSGTFTGTALGNILISTGTDISLARFIVAKSLVSLNTTGRLNLGCNSCQAWLDGANGFQIATTGTANNYSGDENLQVYSFVTLYNATAPLTVTAPNGSISFTYPYITLTTAGGDMTLRAGTSLTLPSNGSLSSSGGLISLTGVGVTQAADNSVNAGSGKIRVDGGNAAVNLNGTLTTTNADTGGSPAVLITRASTVSLRSVTAQTGTLQVGLVGSTNTLATTQTLGSAGALTLTGNTSYYSPRRITLTGTGNNSGVSFTIVGTDVNGNAASQTISGANNGTATTTQYFATVTSVTTNGATSGNVTAGVANESISGSLTQYLPGGYTNAIDIHTLSAASSAAISLTSSSNTIDQLSSFAVGSSLDVEARGRSAGMLLTGNVTATDVVIKTGNGALVLGDYNITSTTGNVWLQGTGVTQTANSTITSAGTTQIYGNDYQNGTRGNVTMAGSIVSASHVYLYSTLNLTLPNITIGSAGSRGNLYIGDNSNNASPWATYNGIYGTISQTAGTAIKIGTLQGLQVAGYGTTDLTNANNEIRYLGYYYRGGAFSVNDADVEANGLTSTSSISDGTSNSAVKINTNGAYNLNGQQLYGQGLTISATSISGSGNLYGHAGTGGSIILIANGGNVTLSGDTYTDGTGADLVIRSANNLQLGSRTHIGNSNLTLGANATTGTLSASQTVAGAGNLSINGTSASSGSVTFTAGQRVAITSAGNDSGITYTVTGTDMFGHVQTETITGANAAAAAGTKYFNTITQIAASGAAAGSVSVGTAVETIAGNVTQTGYIESAPTLLGNVGGSITLNNSSNTFQKIGNLTSGGNMTLYSAVNPLIVSGAALSTGGNVNISGGYNLTVNGTGSVSASGSGKSVTLTSGTTLTFGNNSDYATSIQGAVSADTGGVIINSAGSFANNSTGTISSTGGVSIKTYWDTLNARNLVLGGNITAGANGIKLNSSGIINQTGGVLTTTGAVSGPDSSGGGAPGVSNPSARGSVTLNGNNQVGSLGPFYVYNTSGGTFSFNDTTGGLTLAGIIETSNGNITISTAGGALNLATYGVYAGELATGGANIALTGQGITQASGIISATGSADGTTPRNGSSGGTITLTGYDGTSSGAINLGGTISTANNTASAVTIRGTAALALPNISAPNGSLNIGDTSQTYYHITGAVTQTAATLLDIKTLNVAGDSSAVLANTGNKIVQLGNIAVGNNGSVTYDFDVYNSTNGLSLTHDITSAGGVRVVTTQGAGSSGALALGSYNVYAIGDIYLGALGVTQGSASIIDANHLGTAGSGGNITVDGGGGTNNITLGGTIRTDGAGATLSVLNATNATLNVISAAAGTVALGTNSLALTGSISLVPTTGVVSANTLTGNAGIVNLSVANVDNLGAFTTSGALTLKDQGGAGTAGLKLTGNVTVGAASDIESSDGVLDLDTRTIDASSGTGYDLVLKGVGVSQGTGSMIKSTTAEIFGSTGSINLFSALNDFTGQVTVTSTGSQVALQDANQLSMNSLTGKLANSTSITAWAGTNLVLTPESLTTTSGSIDLRSLNGNLSTPGNLTTGSGSITLLAGGTGSNGNVQVNNLITTGSGNVTVQASKQANLSNSIVSTSGNIAVTGDTVIHSTGSPGNPLTLQTAGAGTITVNAAGTGGFVMGQYYSYQSASGAISITSGGSADLANITSTSGDVAVNAVGAVQQLASSSIKASALTVATTSNGTITLANANNNASYINLRSLNIAGNAAGSGAISYNDLNAVAVRRIQTTGNATLTAGGAITTDTVTGPGTVVANALSVKTLNDSAADISLTAAGNDVTTLTLKVRNAADTADVGVANSTGNIDYTDVNGFTIAGIQSGGSAELTAGGAVAQTGAVLVSGLGLSGTGSFTLNNASSGIPINQVSTFASNASGAVNFSSSRALTIGTVTAAGPITGVTSNGAAVTISATSIDSTSGPIDTRSSTPATAGGAVTLTTTGLTTAGNLTVGSIDTSGSTAGASTNSNGGAAGTITLTTTGNTLSVNGVITARGGVGDGSGTTGADGLVTLTANAGAVSQTNGSGTHAIDAGKLLVSSLNASSLLDTGNTTDFLAAKITGAGQGFTYRSAGDYTVGAGNGTITGLSTQGGAIDLGSSNVAITDVETITTKGGNFSANNIGSFNSAGVTISTLGDITFASGAYKNGGAVSITTTSGNITTGAIVTSGDSSASAATAGGVTLNANNVLTTGSITSTGAGTSVGGAVNLTGATVRLGGQINSGGGTGGSSQAAGGNIVVTGPAVVYGADLVLDSGSGTGDVTFSSTINSDNIGSIRSLTVNSGTGNINLQGALGNSVTLKNVALNSSGSTNIGAAVTASSLTTDATGTTHLNGGTINTTGNQTYNDDVILGAATTLTSGGNVNFVATVKSDGTNRALTVNDTGTTTFASTVGGDGSVAGDKLASLTTDAGGTTAINGGSIITTSTQTYGDNMTLGANTVLTGSTVTTQGTVTGNTRTLDIAGNAVFGNDVSDSVTGVATLGVSGTTTINTNTITSTGAQTYTGGVTLGADATLTGVGLNFVSTVKSDGTNRALTINDSGTTTFAGAVGGSGVAGDKLASLTTNAGGTTAINGGSIITTGTQTYSDNVALGGDTTLTGSTVTNQNTITGNSHALNITGNAVFGNDASDSVTGVTALGVSGTSLINTNTITTSGAQTYSGAVTLGTNPTLTGSAINFGSTVDGDADNTRSLNLVSTGGAGQNFVAAVGGIHALDTLRIESVGVVTQGGSAPIHAVNLAIKSASGVTLTNASNAVDVLAALLSGNASLSFVDSTGLEIGTVGSAALQVVGISDGAGTSTVSITVGGPLTQAASSPINLRGSLAIDTSAYNAGDVTVDNTGATGTVLGDSLIAGDFTLASTGNVTQASGANLQVGGNFNVTGGGSYIDSGSADNLIGGGSASVAGNQIRLYGIITLSTDAGTGDLLASAFNGTTTTTASIGSTNLAAGVQVVSAAGGNSISPVNSGAAVTLNQANNIHGSLSITTQGTYSNSGTPVATGINQSNALNLSEAAFTVQQSAANAGSIIAGAGKLDLSNTTNTFDGTVSLSAVGMDAKLSASTNIDLGNVSAQSVTIATTQDITQAALRLIQADTLLLSNAHNVTLNNANLVNTLAASGLTGALSFNDAQALSVGTASTVDGIDSSGSVLLKTTTGDLVLDESITVAGSSNITLVSAANFTNNVGANALTLGTGHWQVWSTDPGLDTLNGLTPNFKQYNATYGTSTVLGSGNGVLYTLAPELTISLTGAVERVYDADIDATLTQANYNVSGTLGGDAVVLGTSGTFNNKNVANNKTVTVNPVVVSASDGAIQVYGYQIDSGSATISAAIGKITPADITAVTGITASNKTYNANTSATLNTTSTVGFTGMFNGDQLTVASATGNFASPNASASPITVNITGISLGGTDAGNYTLSTTTASTTALINAYAVNLTGTRAYDGTTTVGSGSLTIGSLVGGQTLTLSGSGTAASKNAGLETVNTTGLTLVDGTGLASNYTFVGGTQTINITKANLSVTTSNVTKTYDGSLSGTGTAIVTAGTQLFSTDSLTGGTYAFTNANAGTGNRTVTTTGVTLNDGNNGNNYVVSYVNNTTSTINKADITVSTSNVTKTYDGNLSAAGTATVVSGTLYHNASNSNVLDNLTGGTYAFTDKNAGTGNKVVTAAGVAVTDGNSGNNYNVTYANNTTSTINPYAVNVTGTRVYDGTTTVGASSLTLGTLVGSETLILSGSGTAASKNVGLETVNSSGLTLVDGTGLASNYTFSGGTQTVNITKANVTLTTSDVTKIYNGTLAAVGSAVATNSTQLFGSDTVSGGTYAFTNANAGTGKTVTTSGVTVNDGNSGNNYIVSYANNTTSTITRADITVASTNVTKTYDGTLSANGSATLVSGTLFHNASNSGALDNLSGGSFAFTDKNAGTGNKSVTASGVSVVDGNSSGNYNITYANNTTSTINRATVGFVGTVSDKEYDGTTTASLSNYSLTGLIGSETLNASAGSANFIDKNASVGKTVNLGGIALADGSNGGLASNYTVAGTANTTATITPKVLTVNATVSDKVYDGTTTASMQGYGLAGFVGSETVTGVGGSGSFANKNVGNDKTVTITGITLVNGANGGLATNYAVSTNANSNADITQATLNIAGVIAEDKVYDGTLVANLNTSAAAITGIFGADDVHIGLINGTYQTKDVGTNKAIGAGAVLLSGTDSANYILTQPTGLSSSITPRALTVAATGNNKVYDGTTGAIVNLSDNRISGDVLSVSSSSNFMDKNAGTGKYVSVSNIAISGTDAHNYSVNSTAAASANITKANLVVTATGVNKVYDATTGATVSLSSQAIGNDVVTVAYNNATFNNKNVGTGKQVTVNGISLNGADASNYTINGGVATTANITPATLTVGATGNNKAYDGTTVATVTFSDNRYTGDQLTLADNAAIFVDAAIGNDKSITVTGIHLTGGTDAGNYVLANTGLVTSGDILGSTTDVAAQQSSLPPVAPTTPGLPTITTPPTLLDVTLPTNFGDSYGAPSNTNTVTTNGANTNGTNTGGSTTSNSIISYTSGGSTSSGTNGGTSSNVTGTSNVISRNSNTNTSTNNSSTNTANNGGSTGTGVNGGSATGTSTTTGTAATNRNSTGSSSNATTTSASGSTSTSASTGTNGSNAGSSTAKSSSSGTASDADAGSQVSVALVQDAAAGKAGLITVLVPPEMVASATGFSFPLPAVLVDAAAKRKIKVTLKNGKRLPSWLQYVPGSKTFVASAVPPGALPLEILVSIGSQTWNVVISPNSGR